MMPGVTPTLPAHDAAQNGEGIPFVLMVAAALGLVIVYRLWMRRATRYLAGRSGSDAVAADKALFVARYTYFGVALVFYLALFGRSLSGMGLSLAFISTLASWALRAPVTNLAAWMMVVIRKPYLIGDRVVIGEFTGDVKDISVSYTLLEQVGGTVSGDEKSGRSILVPNQNLFAAAIVNYRLDEDTVLDEVPVRITYDSDLSRAEAAILAAARAALSERGVADKREPYVVHELIPSGVISRVRYHVQPVRRQEIASAIVASIHARLSAEPAVRFCYVQSVAHMSAAQPSDPFPPQHPDWVRSQPSSC